MAAAADASEMIEQPTFHTEETRPLLLRSLSDPTSAASTSQPEWRNFTVTEQVPASMASCTDLAASVNTVEDVGSLESSASTGGYTGYSDAPTVCIRDEENSSGDASENQQNQDCQTSCTDFAQHCSALHLQPEPPPDRGPAVIESIRALDLSLNIRLEGLREQNHSCITIPKVPYSVTQLPYPTQETVKG